MTIITGHSVVLTLWIMTYDHTQDNCCIYTEFEPQSFDLTYTTQTKRKGSEVIIHGSHTKKVFF